MANLMAKPQPQSVGTPTAVPEVQDQSGKNDKNDNNSNKMQGYASDSSNASSSDVAADLGEVETLFPSTPSEFFDNAMHDLGANQSKSGSGARDRNEKRRRRWDVQKPFVGPRRVPKTVPTPRPVMSPGDFPPGVPARVLEGKSANEIAEEIPRKPPRECAKDRSSGYTAERASHERLRKSDSHSLPASARTTFPVSAEVKVQELSTLSLAKILTFLKELRDHQDRTRFAVVPAAYMSDYMRDIIANKSQVEDSSELWNYSLTEMHDALQCAGGRELVEISSPLFACTSNYFVGVKRFHEYTQHFIKEFERVHDFLAFNNSECMPEVNTNDYGILKTFLSKIPFRFGWRVHSHMHRNKFADLHEFLGLFSQQVTDLSAAHVAGETSWSMFEGTDFEQARQRKAQLSAVNLVSEPQTANQLCAVSTVSNQQLPPSQQPCFSLVMFGDCRNPQCIRSHDKAKVDERCSELMVSLYARGYKPSKLEGNTVYSIRNEIPLEQDDIPNIDWFQYEQPLFQLTAADETVSPVLDPDVCRHPPAAAGLEWDPGRSLASHTHEPSARTSKLAIADAFSRPNQDAKVDGGAQSEMSVCSISAVASDLAEEVTEGKPACSALAKRDTSHDSKVVAEMIAGAHAGHPDAKSTHHRLGLLCPGHEIPFARVRDSVHNCGVCQKVKVRWKGMPAMRVHDHGRK
eukprot:CAMPEP_0175031890 /NCGR_PEP_ID=MMETSP0005-20121125/21096_1 /TAXON_ID=420556 /ORGANISM="Ochromonas sp., Strain CCMP1393" /LENGTH=689 /DNA_ID=CAMNT_0016292249 /DNA_START=21 /DNA_END=2092 /DNA_ORIENTATION=-